MKLFVWPPAFESLSIDPECLAALLYLESSRAKEESLTFVYSQDPRLSPTGEFPLLDCCCGRLIGGLNAIVAHWHKNHSSQHVDQPTADCEGAQTKANNIALIAFIRASGLPLLDLYLYVSYENYYHATSTEWTQGLHWITNYITPAARRRLAKARTAHLGITSLDIDSVHDGTGRLGQDKSNVATAQVGKGSMESLLAQQNRLKSLLTRPQHTDIFRLDALADNFLGPLEDILRQQMYLCGKSIGDADFLAYGYLSLMLFPKMPKRWLADAIEKKYPKVHSYLLTLRDKFRTMGPDESPVQVQWQSLSNVSAMGLVGKAIMEEMPFGTIFSSKITSGTPSVQPSTLRTQYLYPFALSIGFATAAVLAAFSYFQPYGHNVNEYSQKTAPSQSAQLLNFGEAGDLLSALGQQIDIETDMERERERIGNAVITEVDITPQR